MVAGATGTLGAQVVTGATGTVLRVVDSQSAQTAEVELTGETGLVVVVVVVAASQSAQTVLVDFAGSTFLVVVVVVVVDSQSAQTVLVDFTGSAFLVVVVVVVVVLAQSSQVPVAVGSTVSVTLMVFADATARMLAAIAIEARILIELVDLMVWNYRKNREASKSR